MNLTTSVRGDIGEHVRPHSILRASSGLEMTSDDFSALATSRGEGLHPKLRELFERTIVRSDRSPRWDASGRTKPRFWRVAQDLSECRSML